MKADIAYLVINYTIEVAPRQYDDLGPVLVKTGNYMCFYPAGTDQEWPLPVLGYELLKHYPLGITEDAAQERFTQEFPLLARTV